MTSASRRRTSTLKVTSALAVLGASVLLAGAAQAEETLTISYKKYQLQSQAGAEDVYAQIENAVKDYCITPGVRPVQQKMQERECVARMLDEAIRKVSNQRLSRIHDGTTNPVASLAP